MTVKKFFIEYDAINSQNTFTNRDEINGRIILETSKETRIESLIFTAKGKGRIQTQELIGKYGHKSYPIKEMYFEVKHHILGAGRQDGTDIVGKGRHIFPFSFKIPDRNMPSSFQSPGGQIVYKLKAELKQSMMPTKKAQASFTYVSKTDMDTPALMNPQHEHADKSTDSGNVSFDVFTNKMGYQQGETLTVRAEIRNQSSQPVTPKFKLYAEDRVFGPHKMILRTIILKKSSQAVQASSESSVVEAITIRQLRPSILYDHKVTLEYKLKISLDIDHTSNPNIILPIVILPKVPDVSGVTRPIAAHFGF